MENSENLFQKYFVEPLFEKYKIVPNEIKLNFIKKDLEKAFGNSNILKKVDCKSSEYIYYFVDAIKNLTFDEKNRILKKFKKEGLSELLC